MSLVCLVQSSCLYCRTVLYLWFWTNKWLIDWFFCNKLYIMENSILTVGLLSFWWFQSLLLCLLLIRFELFARHQLHVTQHMAWRLQHTCRSRYYIHVNNKVWITTWSSGQSNLAKAASNPRGKSGPPSYVSNGFPRASTPNKTSIRPAVFAQRSIVKPHDRQTERRRDRRLQ